MLLKKTDGMLLLLTEQELDDWDDFDAAPIDAYTDNGEGSMAFIHIL